jgi:hypothetical protein
MQRRSTRLYVVVAMFSAAILYGATYQQFRFFDSAKPGGASDAIEYIRMAQGIVPDDAGLRHYRWLTPAAARLVLPATEARTGDPDLGMRLAFYIVNYGFSLVACLALFAMLQTLGYTPPLSLLGVCAFATSRPVVLVTGTPMVDAAYFSFIAVLAYLMVARMPLALSLLLPVFALGKETIWPFLLLPLFAGFRRAQVLCALAAGAAAVTVKVEIVDAYYPTDANIAANVSEHAAAIGRHAARLLTPAGLHDAWSAFSFMLVLAAAGAWLNRRHRLRRIPGVLVAMIPIAVIFALLSGNLGRMLFAAFPVVIAYALMPLERIADARVSQL